MCLFASQFWTEKLREKMQQLPPGEMFIAWKVLIWEPLGGLWNGWRSPYYIEYGWSPGENGCSKEPEVGFLAGNDGLFLVRGGCIHVLLSEEDAWNLAEKLHLSHWGQRAELRVIPVRCRPEDLVGAGENGAAFRKVSVLAEDLPRW